MRRRRRARDEPHDPTGAPPARARPDARASPGPLTALARAPQLSDGAAEPAFGIELRGRTSIDACAISARCRAKNSAGVLARGAAASPTLHACTIRGCGHAGVLLAAGARATLSRCDVADCAAAGCLALAGCLLTVSGGSVTGSAEHAVAVAAKGAASLTACSLKGNGGPSGVATVSIKAGGRVAMREVHVLEARGMGVQLADGAEAELASCVLTGCAKAGLAAKAVGSLRMEKCTVSEGQAVGVMILQPSAGAVLVKDNTFVGNAKAAIQLSAGANPLIESNKILDGLGAGM